MTTTVALEELKSKVARLAKTVHDINPPEESSLEEWVDAVIHGIYLANIYALKDLIDRHGEGEKPRLIVESSGIPPKTGIPQDRIYMPHNIPEYHQVMLDMLKKQELVPDDAMIRDYEFLFNFDNNTKSELRND